MAVPPNIDRFNKVTLLVFDKLYASFPVPIELDASKIAMDTLPDDATFDESFQSIEPVYYAISFLKREGFIDFNQTTLDGHTFLRAQLTSKSLALLGQTPTALEAQTSISERISSLLKGGIKNVGSEAAKKMVELLFANGGAALSAAAISVGISM